MKTKSKMNMQLLSNVEKPKQSQTILYKILVWCFKILLSFCILILILAFIFGKDTKDNQQALPQKQTKQEQLEFTYEDKSCNSIGCGSFISKASNIEINGDIATFTLVERTTSEYTKLDHTTNDKAQFQCNTMEYREWHKARPESCYWNPKDPDGKLPCKKKNKVPATPAGWDDWRGINKKYAPSKMYLFDKICVNRNK